MTKSNLLETASTKTLSKDEPSATFDTFLNDSTGTALFMVGYNSYVLQKDEDLLMLLYSLLL